jgi:hypothetical protein
MPISVATAKSPDFQSDDSLRSQPRSDQVHRSRQACATRAEMREFMDYVHSAFYEATGWRRDNSYAALNSTTDGNS